MVTGGYHQPDGSWPDGSLDTTEILPQGASQFQQWSYVESLPSRRYDLAGATLGDNSDPKVTYIDPTHLLLPLPTQGKSKRGSNGDGRLLIRFFYSAVTGNIKQVLTGRSESYEHKCR